MTIEQHIEELRAELRNAENGAERRQIQAELELAQAELIVAAAELDGLADANRLSEAGSIVRGLRSRSAAILLSIPFHRHWE